MVAGLEHVPGAAADHAGAHRHAAGQALGERHHVGQEAGVLVDEPLAGAPQAALYFVGHEQPLVAVADFLESLQVLQARDVDAAFALDRLDEHRHHVLVVRRDLAHRLQVVQRHAHEALHQRLEAGLHLAAGGGRQRRQRAAVEGLLHDDDRRLGDTAVVAVLARDLDRRFVGFQAGIAEEHLVQAGDGGDAVGGLLLQRDLEQVGRVDDAADLLGERAHQARVVVPERVDRDAGERIEVLLARLIPQPYALASHERDRLAGVGVHDVAHGVAPL